MPARRAGGGVNTTRRKHSLGNLRRAHPASGATWNVQVVRGKMSSKCLWHACRALILGLTLLLVGAGMATLGYYADNLSIGSEIRGNATVRVKNELKGFHLNNFSYVGPIVMGFGGFIVVASCVMTFEARDSAAKVVPARLRTNAATKLTACSNQSSSASQRRAIGMQFQNTRWDQQFGVFRSSPAADTPQPPNIPLDREALTAELVKFSKSLSASARFSPQLRRVTFTGSVPNLSTHHALHPLAYSTNISHLLSPKHKPLLLLDTKRHRNHHRHHHHHNHNYNNHHHHHHHHHANNRSSATTIINNATVNENSNRQIKSRGTRISNSLIQRTTRENVTSTNCTLLQPPSGANKLHWHAASFDETCRLVADKQQLQKDRMAERTKRSDTAKRHVLARQKPIEQEEDRDKQTSSSMENRRCSTLSDTSYSGRWTARCASLASRASTIDSRRIQVDLHSPEVMPKSILRSPKRYSSGPSTTPSVEKEFRSQLSVCSEPPPAIRQLSGQSSLEPCLPEETIEIIDDKLQINHTTTSSRALSSTTIINPVDPPPPQTTPPSLPTATVDYTSSSRSNVLKKPRPESLFLMENPNVINLNKNTNNQERNKNLQRSNSSRTYDRPKTHKTSQLDDSIFYIRSENQVLQNCNDFYDSEKVINERRTTLLKADSETALMERKLNSFSVPEKILEHAIGGLSINMQQSKPSETTVLQIESDIQKDKVNSLTQDNDLV